MDNVIVLSKGSQFRSLLPGGSYSFLSLSRADSYVLPARGGGSSLRQAAKQLEIEMKAEGS